LHVTRLGLEDFRNYETQAIELERGLNLVIGRNAQGKTNLLEALYCLSGFGSPRSPDAALVRAGAEQALLHAEVVRGERAVEVDMEFRPKRAARALVNKKPVRSAKVLAELTVSVFFGPDELSLVKGSPDGRRRFLDDLIVKLRPAQDGLRREWDRVLRQRNALLKALRKEGQRPSDELEVWDDAFALAGAKLGAARLRALAALTPYAARRYENVAGGGALRLRYESSWVPEDLAAAVLDDVSVVDEDALARSLSARMEEVRRAELERGVSLAGPGRDDVSVALSAPSAGGGFLDARSFASQGDQRTAALALKLGEHDLLSEVLDEPPVLLLDDVFSELDAKRRGWLRDAVRDAGQTLLSSAETSGWEEVGAERTFFVDAGVVSVLAG